MDKLYEEVPKMAAACPQAGLTQLLNHVSSEPPVGFHKAFFLITPSDKLLSPGEIYVKRSKGVLMFGNYYDCGECDNLHVGVGATATALTPDGICMTNYHVMEDIIKKDKEALAGDSLFYVATQEGKCYPVMEILTYSRLGDLAIFRIDTRGDKLEAIPLGDPAPTASRVHVIAHPKQQFYYYTQGVVARNSRYDYGDDKVTHRMEITADFAVGSSGGPILDDCGSLIGMVASTTSLYFDDEKKAPVQMIVKSTIPVRVIKELLKL